MLSILDLPNELIDRIIWAMPPADLLSLALSNRTIHSLAAKALVHHFELGKKYSTLTFGDFDEEGDDPDKDRNVRNNPLLFLGVMMENPSIRYYPTSIYLHGSQFDVGGGLLVDEIKRRRSFIEKHSVALKQMVEKCHFIPRENKKKVASAICSPWSHRSATNLLVTMLPNLRSIITQDLWVYSNGSKDFSDLIWSIAEANRDPESSCHRKALTRLENFVINYSAFESGEDIDGFGPLATLPSMRNLWGTKIQGERFHWPHNFKVGLSNVTDIDFTESAVGSEAFETLLSRISALKKFRYHHIGSTVSDAIYDPTSIVKILRRSAAASLQLLDVWASEHKDSFDDGQERQCTGSLKGFSALESIRLEVLALRRPEWNQPLVPGFNKGEKYSEIENDANVVPSKIGDPAEAENSMERLVDLLPASVKDLTLIRMMGDTEMGELLQGMPYEKAAKLPNLELVRFDGRDPLNDDIKAALKHVGLVLMHWDVVL